MSQPGVYLRRLYRSRSRSHAELRFIVSHAVAAARNARTNVITPLFHREWHIAAKGGRYSFAIPWRRSPVTTVPSVRVRRSYMDRIASPSRSTGMQFPCVEGRLFVLLFINQRFYVHYARIAWRKDQRDDIYGVYVFRITRTLFRPRISLGPLQYSRPWIIHIFIFRHITLSGILAIYNIRRFERPLAARNCIANTKELRAHVIRRNARIMPVTSLSGRTIAAPALD